MLEAPGGREQGAAAQGGEDTRRVPDQLGGVARPHGGPLADGLERAAEDVGKEAGGPCLAGDRSGGSVG